MKKKRLEIKLFTLKEKRDRDQLWKSSDQIRTQLKKTVSFSNLILNSEGILFFTETLIKKVLLEVKSMKKAIRLKETYR